MHDLKQTYLLRLFNLRGTYNIQLAVSCFLNILNHVIAYMHAAHNRNPIISWIV